MFASLRSTVITILCVLSSAVATRAQDPWVSLFGGSSLDAATSVTLAHDSGYVVCGYYQSNDGAFAGLHRGGYDIVVSKYSKEGAMLWMQTFGGSQHDQPSSVDRTIDGGYVITGRTSSNDGDFAGMAKGGQDAFVMKLDAMGVPVWKQVFGGTSNDSPSEIATGLDGSYVLTGGTTSTDGDLSDPDQNVNDRDAFVTKLADDGRLMWTKRFGGSDLAAYFGDYGTSLTYAPNGRIIVAGDIASTGGDFEGLTTNATDFFVIELDTDGTVMWKQAYGGFKDDKVASIRAIGTDGYIVTGHTSSEDGTFAYPTRGQLDGFVMKLNQMGSVQWTMPVGGSNVDVPSSIVALDDGNVVVTGFTFSTDHDVAGMTKGAGDVFASKIDASGSRLWTSVFGGSQGDYCSRTISTPNGGFVVVGWTWSSDGDFSGARTDSLNGFVMKLNANGDVDRTTSVNSREPVVVHNTLRTAPNPAAATVTTSLAVASMSHVRVEIVSTTGMVVDVLFEGFLDTGTHALTHNVSDLPTGCYFIRSSTAGTTATSPLLILR